MKYDLIIGVIIGGITLAGMVLISIGHIAAKPDTINKPYIIVFESPNKKDYEKCQKSENCLDVLSFEDLPERKD